VGLSQEQYLAVLADALDYLASDDQFWQSYSYVRESFEDNAQFAKMNEFNAAEFSVLTQDPNGPRLSVPAAIQAIHFLNEARKHTLIFKETAPSDVRRNIEALALTLRNAPSLSAGKLQNQDDPDGLFGSILRKVGRGLLVLCGAAVDVADTWAIIATVGAATPVVVASLPAGAALIAAGAMLPRIEPNDNDAGSY
jgi:hypothetical protein